MQKTNGQELFWLEERNHRVRVWSSYLLKLESNSMKECFQSCFEDCLSTSGLYGRCMNGLHFLSLPGLTYPSRPAQSFKWNWKLMLELLQIVVYDLHHLYDVYGWCLDNQNSRCSSQTMNSNLMAVLQACWIWHVILSFSLICVNFKIQTSFKWILKHIRHQFDQSFSLIFKNASFHHFELWFMKFEKVE